MRKKKKTTVRSNTSKALKIFHKNKAIHKIATEPDYVYSKQFNFSIKEILEKHPDGLSDRSIAKLLKISPEELQILFQIIIVKLKEGLK